VAYNTWADTSGPYWLHDSTASNQRDSPLLQLPAELRNAIYALAIGGHLIRICRRSQCEGCQDTHMLGHAIHCPSDVLALSKTCCQIHAETRHLPLSSNTFCGYDQDLVVTFDAIFDKHHAETITLLCVLVGNINYEGLRRLSGLKRVDIFSEAAYSRLRKREKANVILERKLAREMKKNKAVSQVEATIIGKQQLQKIGLDFDTLPSPVGMSDSARVRF
jgi:hypothetical protein